jgi:exodeoxyribonuclease III
MITGMSGLRIVSYNVNGIRAAMGKGLIEWLATDPADIVCIQETKAHRENVAHALFTELGYHDYWFSARKKGYSGVAVFTRIKPDHVEYGTGHAVSDDEGRVIQLDFGNIRLINAYFPASKV